jgi:hypothetical protein
MKIPVLLLATPLLFVSAQAAVTLAEVNFSGTATSQVGTFTQANAQFTVFSSLISSAGFSPVGGTLSTATWAYDGTGTAAANADLYTVSTFGGPTRLDLDLGFATTGANYTITTVEIDVRESNSAGTTWEFGYRRASDNTTHTVGAQTISVQSGADPITTYSINLVAANLTADDTSRTWVNDGTGKLRFLFFQSSGTNNDNLQIDAIRVIGVPEPSAALLGVLGLLRLLRRRR